MCPKLWKEDKRSKDQFRRFRTQKACEKKNRSNRHAGHAKSLTKRSDLEREERIEDHDQEPILHLDAVRNTLRLRRFQALVQELCLGDEISLSGCSRSPIISCQHSPPFIFASILQANKNAKHSPTNPKSYFSNLLFADFEQFGAIRYKLVRRAIFLSSAENSFRN